jgi:uncharacterized repeat protein (TIGR03803 family)
MGKRLLLAWLLCFAALSVFSQLQPNFYVLTSGNGGGTISKYVSATNTLTAVFRFTNPNLGTNPYGSLTMVNGKLYGLTVSGGEKNQGVIFSFDTATHTYSKLHDFNLPIGSFPQGTLTIGKNGKLYGTTRLGGNLALNGGIGYGTLFSFDPATNLFARHIDFNHWTGTSPMGIELTATGDGNLWGMTSSGGEFGFGTLFVFEPATGIFASRYHFNGINGARAEGNHLTLTPDGKLWGITTGGGLSGMGLIFSYEPGLYRFTRHHSFSMSTGSNPSGRLLSGTNGKFYGMTASGGSNGVGVIYSFDHSTGTYTKITDLTSPGGSMPLGSLINARNGLLYGVTNTGGASNQGVIFSLNPSTSAYTKLQDFNGSNGSHPQYTSLLEVSAGSSNPVDNTCTALQTVTIKGTAGSTNFKQILLNSRHPSGSDTTQPEIPATAWTCNVFNVPLCQTRGLFKYDLTSIPQNAVIESATLQLFARSDNQNGQTGNPMFGTNNSSLLQMVTTPWSVSNTGWANQPSTTTVGQKVLPQSTSNLQNYVVDVKEFVQTWVTDPSKNNGMLLRLMTEEIYNSMVFQSGRAPDAQKPTLMIRYIVPASRMVIRGTLGSPLFSQALLNSRGAFISDTTQPEIPAGAWTCSSLGAPTCQVRGLFRFNVSALPVNARISSARLFLYAKADNINGTSGSPMFGTNNTSVLQKVTAPWNIAQVGWANQPATTSTGEKLLPQSTSTLQNYEIDVTDFVQGWASDPSSNFGMLLKLVTEQYYNSMIFHSGQAADSLKPRLEICYTTASAPGAERLENSVVQNGMNQQQTLGFLEAFPNPANDYVELRFKSKHERRLAFSFIDANGKVVRREERNATQGPNVFLFRNLQKLSKGLYQVKVDDQENVLTTKILVQ